MTERYAYRPGVMPAKPVVSQTELIEVGPLAFGVEYRIVSDALAGINYGRRKGVPGEPSVEHEKRASSRFDSGVSLHVFDNRDEVRQEYLRFDCFSEDPHYHYIDHGAASNQLRGIDPAAVGDPLEWALECVRSRLPQMLARAGATDLAGTIDQKLLTAAIPAVAAAAYHARFHSDEQVVFENALKS